MVNILHIAALDMTRINGIRFSVPGLANSQNKFDNVNIGVYTISQSNRIDFNEIKHYNFKFFYGYSDIDLLPVPFNNPDLVIFHGVYFIKYLKFYKKLLKLNIPYIIVPHSSLTEGAQRQKYLKKYIANLLFFNKFIDNATSIHYLTENERILSSKQFKTASFVVGNGVNLSTNYKKSINNDRLVITYMGRYDINHKGLDILLKAILKIKDKLISNKVTINFYGSDYLQGLSFINHFINKYNLSILVNINKPVFGEQKAKVLLNTDIFIATSRFEGHPIAVIEAMSYGVPCILTPGTNMTDLLIKYNAGWPADLKVDNIAESIVSAISNKNDILVKGNNARKLIEENYTWEIVAKKTLDIYLNIINNSKNNLISKR